MSQPLMLSGWRYRVLIGSVVCSALAYLGISLWGGWAAVSRAIGQVGWWNGTLIVGLVLLGYGLRFGRWQVYLNALGHSLPCWISLKIYLAGFALTTTPGKAGEALRGVLLRRWNVPYAHSFAALFSERFSDLLAMVVLALLGLSVHPQWLPLIITSLVLLACGVLLVTRPALIGSIVRGIDREHSWFSRLLCQVVQVLHQARRCHTPRRQIGATMLSLMAWGLEVLAFFWILKVMEAGVSLTSAMFIYAVSMLAGALSFMPGGLGSTEAVMVGFLVSSGVGLPGAIAATILLRCLTLWLAVGVGALALASINEPVEQRQRLINFDVKRIYMSRSASRNPLFRYVALTLVIVLGAILRRAHLFDAGLWMDELFSAWASDPMNSLGVVFQRTVEDVHPPLYQILLWLVYKGFGYGEMVGRILSMILGVAVIPAMYGLGTKLFNSNVGLLAACFSAINFHLIFFSQNTRSYALLVLLVVLCFTLFVDFLKEPSPQNALLYGLVCAALVNTHYFGFLPVMSQAVLIVYTSIQGRVNYRLLAVSGVIGLFILLSLIPVLSYMLINFRRTETWITRPSDEFVLDALLLPFGSLASALICLVLLAVGLNTLFKNDDELGSLSLLLCWWFLGFAVAYVRSVFFTPILSIKNVVVFVPAMLIITAYGLHCVRSMFVKGVVLIFGMLMSISFLFSHPVLSPSLRLDHDLRSPTLVIISRARHIPVYARWDTLHATYFKLLGSSIGVAGLDVLKKHLQSGKNPGCFYVIADQWERPKIDDYPSKFGVVQVNVTEFENAAVIEFCDNPPPPPPRHSQMKDRIPVSSYSRPPTEP